MGRIRFIAFPGSVNREANRFLEYPDPMLATDAAPSLLATPEDFKRGMRQLAAGVNVITVAVAGIRDGLTATAVCSISAEPPHLLVCVNSSAAAHGPIHRAGSFCLNVLANDQEAIAKRFANMDGSDRTQRFDLGKWSTLSTGSPVLDGALANFDCIVVREIEAATHTLFIGRVLAVRNKEDGSPLIYSNGRFTGINE
jgi:flavin reductase (DIM6/NTAB) family NADH-FMN oxidoreductase RutF